MDAVENGPVTLATLAAELGMERSGARKWALSQGVEFLRIRTPESRGQETLALTREDADSLRELRSAQGFVTDDDSTARVITPTIGFFYLVQLVPDLKPTRVKVGFTNDLDSRLRAHRTSAPTAQLLDAWPCRLAWEVAAIASVSRNGCNQVGPEVFDCDDLAMMRQRCADFFALMPICN